MKYNQNTIVSVMAIMFSAACASAEGTKPHDMSTAHHEAAAKREAGDAAQHGEQYDPTAAVKSTTCTKGTICWTSTRNPTAQHKADESQHRELAEKHRAAAQALRDAENNACAGIDEADRVVSPFYHREDIASVRKVERPVGDSLGGARTEFAGGGAVFRAVPGLTAEWLQREVNCHLARAAAVGFSMPEMSYCPLMLKGVTGEVSSTGDGFLIAVTSTDPATASEIWRRIQALK